MATRNPGAQECAPYNPTFIPLTIICSGNVGSPFMATWHPGAQECAPYNLIFTLLTITRSG